MDTISGALQSKDGQHKFYPETTIANVIGLETQLAKAITNLTANGGAITITKADGTTSTITIATSTSAGGGGGVTGVKGNAESTYRTGNVNITPDNIGAATTDIATATKAGLMSAELFDKLDKIEAGAQKNSTAIATTTANGLMSKEDKSILNNLVSGSVSGVKGNSESTYRTGNVNITAANIGLGSVDNTADSAKTVAKANQLTTARTIRTNLASTSTASFNGTADVTPGVTGTLQPANGGTGQTSLSNVSVGSAATCTGNAATATKATQDESGNNIKASYAASFSISDHTITLKNKNGASLGTVTVPDNNTTYTAGTGISLNGTQINCTVTNTDSFRDGHGMVGGNLNEYITPGVYHFNTSGATNYPSGMPTGGNFVLWVFNTNNSNTSHFQILIHAGDVPQSLYVRGFYNTSGGNWTKLI